MEGVQMTPEGEQKQENWKELPQGQWGIELFISKFLPKYCHCIEFSIKTSSETIIK
jgi:hypothetical protein